MYYVCSEKKGADKLRGYREAHLRLCFYTCKKPFFHDAAQMSLDLKDISYRYLIMFVFLAQSSTISCQDEQFNVLTNDAVSVHASFFASNLQFALLESTHYGERTPLNDVPDPRVDLGTASIQRGRATIRASAPDLFRQSRIFEQAFAAIETMQQRLVTGASHELSYCNYRPHRKDMGHMVKDMAVSASFASSLQNVS